MYVYEYVWVLIFWVCCISCTYRKKKNSHKKKKELLPSALFHMKIRVCFKYFINDCSLRGMLHVSEV